MNLEAVLKFAIEYLQQRSPRERKILAGTGIAGLVYILLSLWLPAQQAAAGLAQERESLQREVAGLRATLERLQASVPAVPAQFQTGDLAGGAGEALEPTDTRVSPVLEDMHRLARASDVELVAVRPQTLVDKGDYVTMTIHMELRAGFQEITDYLRMLEDLPRLVEVRTFKVEAESGAIPLVAAHLETLTYLPKS